MGRFRIKITVILAMAASAQIASAQRPVTLQQAIDAALTSGPRIAIVRADSLAAEARVRTARAYPNPTLSPAYTKDAPQYHIELEQPFEYPFLRAARIRAATLGVRGVGYLAAAERASVRYEVEVAYANAAAAVTVKRLSNRNAADALEMLRITRERERLGDASELDTKLAEVGAGQAQLQALTDSLLSITTALELQALMGMSAKSLEITAADSLDTDNHSNTISDVAPLRLTAAEQQVEIEKANVAAARAARLPAPALRVGIEWHDPDDEDAKNKKKPLIGIAVPLPLWDRNRGPIEEARAAEARANAEVALVTLQTQNATLLAQQELSLARSRVQRGREVMADAQRVASLSLTAYREGAYTLANVLEAQRSARDAVRTFIEAMQAGRVAQAALTRAIVVGGPVQ
ncbi:MAG TPA: TolC family protein [Longimicrobiales bacterium]|nr:TolC family protein [Longimicrobiales bacterium]